MRIFKNRFSLKKSYEDCLEKQFSDFLEDFQSIVENVLL